MKEFEVDGKKFIVDQEMLEAIRRFEQKRETEMLAVDRVTGKVERWDGSQWKDYMMSQPSYRRMLPNGSHFDIDLEDVPYDMTTQEYADKIETRLQETGVIWGAGGGPVRLNEEGEVIGLPDPSVEHKFKTVGMEVRSPYKL